jgi:glyoxylase-like metal-dependent hydrolase (beta-lactamase superfamily II)
MPMADEVLPGIHRIELPLPRNPLRSINSYLIKGDNRNLIVDTGMNRPECRDILDSELIGLKNDASKTDVFVTHLHADHLGLAPHITRGKTKVFMGREDVKDINESDYWKDMLTFALLNGFPAVDPEASIRKHPGYKYGPLGPMDMNPVCGGEVFEVGNYRFRAIHTPGHSRGHMCLFDEDKKILFSGDHILGDITPNISLWQGNDDPLSDYIRSLEMVRKLDVEIALPGHRSLIKDHVKRISDLIRHHHHRAEEIMNIIGDGEMNAFEIASRMKWDLTIKKFEEFPIMQKWFALGEALAHLRFLENKGKVSREYSNGIISYHSI